MTSQELSYNNIKMQTLLIEKYKKELKVLREIVKIHSDYSEHDQRHIDFIRGKIYKLECIIEDLNSLLLL